ncbi:hypothetical protein B0O99DRAFT_742606 [Bisporella sp. PMI_857]|nr:hypothetical protein B0O99DRAFT_742606 [Bisporella sp. PMI_857]
MAPESTVTADTAAVCSSLSAALPGKVLVPGTADYTANKISYFTQFESEVSPACFIQPQSTEEVAAIIKHARLTCSEFAVRSGGHTTWAGSANADAGITIDLSKLKVNAVVVDPRTKLATIGAGARWGDVYQTLAAQGLTVVGGRVSSVGVGGLSLGGGLSYYSPIQGFVCDSIVNYEVVLASGEIVQANKNVNADLFVALKGGSNNFGIVTSWQTKTFTDSQMWGGFTYYNNAAYPALVSEFNKFATTTDVHASIIVATSYISGLGEACVSNIYYTAPVANPPALQPFLEIEPKLVGAPSTIRFDSQLGFAQEQAAFNKDGSRQWYFTTSFHPTVQFMLDIRVIWQEAVAKLQVVEGLMFSFVFQPVSKAVLAQSLAHGPNSLGLKESDGPFVVCLINPLYTNSSDDELVLSIVLDLIQKVDALAVTQGVSVPYRFMNYGYKTQKILEGYGAANVAKLKAVSKKYDPTGFFQTQVPGGYKISKVAI